MPSRFSGQVPLSNQSFSLLPVFHTCDGFDARAHVERSEIDSADECEVFREKITYLFYGRPAFKYGAGEDSSTNLALYPVAFVLNLEKIPKLRRIFPFDTGAMSNKRYKNYIHRKSSILDFELEPQTNRINDVVLHFFGTNDDYLRYSPSDAKILPTSFESASYAEMLRHFAAAPADERRATIEVQAEQVVSLGAGALIGLVLPTPLRDDPLFANFIRANKLMVENYDILVWNPAQCFGLISAGAQRMLEKHALKS